MRYWNEWEHYRWGKYHLPCQGRAVKILLGRQVLLLFQGDLERNKEGQSGSIHFLMRYRHMIPQLIRLKPASSNVADIEIIFHILYAVCFGFSFPVRINHSYAFLCRLFCNCEELLTDVFGPHSEPFLCHFYDVRCIERKPCLGLWWCTGG